MAFLLRKEFWTEFHDAFGRFCQEFEEDEESTAVGVSDGLRARWMLIIWR